MYIHRMWCSHVCGKYKTWKTEVVTELTHTTTTVVEQQVFLYFSFQVTEFIYRIRSTGYIYTGCGAAMYVGSTKHGKQK